MHPGAPPQPRAGSPWPPQPGSGRPQTSAFSAFIHQVWDVESGDCLQVLEGHTDEIFSAAFNYEGDTIITGSKDNTCRIWKC